MVSHGSLARLWPPRGRWADAMPAGGVFVLAAAGGLRSLIGERQEPWPVTAFGWAMIAAACGALWFRRRHPVAVALGALAATAAYYLTSAYDGPLLVAFVVALYTVAARGRPWAAVALAALSVLAVGAGTLEGNDDVNGVGLFMLAGWLVAVIALGRARHTRLAYVHEVEQRAAGEERLRIARELHDVIGHHISLMEEGRRWRALAGAVQRRPLPALLAAVVALLALSAPALSLRLGFADAGKSRPRPPAAGPTTCSPRASAPDSTARWSW
ncbi:hypothetical protein GCM10010246_45880 [Streptomyces cuspidosporus]|uniref:Signal transduction histidine kinase subgroup 3 dimerisation and phosphoacceptor domain-containing protein n=1 Tax=Streptomyces cuspidosporus TaxID=66882 RepID=A0ABP5TIB8_9ACTN